MGLLGAVGEDVGRRRGVLLTAGTALEPGVVALARYADRWGDDLQVHPANDVRRRAALLRRGLRDWRVAVRVDADVLLPHQDEDVAALLRPWAAQALARTTDGRPDPAVWVVRSCPVAVAALQAVERSGAGALQAGAQQRATTWLPGRWGAQGRRTVVPLPIG